MFKIHGKEYPVSMLKCYLSDQTFEELKWLTKIAQMESNAHTIAGLIHIAYVDSMEQLKQMELAKKIQEEDKAVLAKLPDEKKA